jgi:electron transfer flavoprotein beta subunit
VKIFVCIKEVPDAEAVPEIDHQKKTVTYDRRRWSFRINSSDEYALEEALILKETIPGTTVDVASYGTEETPPLLRRALEMGADRSFILHRDTDSRLPASYTIAGFAEDKGYDLILTGVMSDDNMGFTTGPSIAAHLNFPWASSVTGMSVDIQQKTVTAEREIDSSTLEIVTFRLPALITVQSGINRPRYPSLSNKLKAKSMEIPVIHINTSDLKMCTAETVSLNFPESKKNKLELKGSTGEKAAALYSILRSRGGI